MVEVESHSDWGLDAGMTRWGPAQARIVKLKLFHILVEIVNQIGGRRA